MNNLQALQHRMLQAVLTDGANSLDEIRGDNRANAQMRLAVYQHGYRARLREALATEFPGLRYMAGRRFETLLDCYIDAHPSTHYNIRWYGAGLAAFLDYARPWVERPHLGEMARLDWAISTRFDAEDEPAIGADTLAGIAPDAWPHLRLQLQRQLRILPLSCNADAFRRAADNGSGRPHLRRYRQHRHLLVWQQAMTVRYRWLADDEYPLLLAADEAPIGTLCEQLHMDGKPEDAMRRLAILLHQWLNAGLLRAATIAPTEP